MKKLNIVTATISLLLFVAGFVAQATADEIYGCYNKHNGKLRIVGDHNECRKSENPITLDQEGGQSNGSGPGKLACVTGALGQREPSNGEILIANVKNIDVNDPSEVFHTFYSSPVFVDDITWGLFCNEDWVNTGCSGGTESGGPYDLISIENGCRSDDEEYYDLIMHTTCCKIVESTE